MPDYRPEVSSQFIQSSLQGYVPRWQRKFCAHQTDGGATLLFALGSGGTLYLLREEPGTVHGWSCTELITQQLVRDRLFACYCIDFASAQTPPRGDGPGLLHLAMVINDGANHRLYISLNNSDQDTGWSNNPGWTACPFTPPSDILQIAGLRISDAGHVMVDIVSDPTQPASPLHRYYIDMADPANPLWLRHAGAIDIDGGLCCLGRAADARGIDGVYLAGSGQLVYTPLVNPFNPRLPGAPRRLYLPGGLAADSLAASRNADGSTDLYVAAKETLFYFSANNQRDGATAVPVLSNPLLKGTRELHASTIAGQATVWALNGADQVACMTGTRNSPARRGWSKPIALLANVVSISPYLDRTYRTNTVLAQTGDGLSKTVKSPGSGMWHTHPVVIATPQHDSDTERVASRAYRTRVQLTAPEQASSALSVTLCASNLTSVYINQRYYVIGPRPVEVLTDAAGGLSIVEFVRTLSATRYILSVGGETLIVNPMEQAVAQLACLNSLPGLREASIADGEGSARPLVKTAVTASDLTAVTRYSNCLHQACRDLAGESVVAVMPPSGGMDAGDLFRWLETGVGAQVSVLRDAASGDWLFVAQIAGQPHHVRLERMEQAVAALQWVYASIRLSGEDLMRFLVCLQNVPLPAPRLPSLA